MRRIAKPQSFLYHPELLLPVLLFSSATFAQPPQQPPQPPPGPPIVDPGPRTGTPGAGQPLPGLDSAALAAFNSGKDVYDEVDDVKAGLGPRFNGDSCGGCHAQPAAGGSSPSVNPQIPAASRMGANNHIPAFITPNGPVRVARMRRNPDGSANGGVVALFTISGRADAPGCNATQPDFNALSRNNNLTLRIPTPTFGAGLIESIPEATLQANLAANSALKAAHGIKGRLNTNGNDGTITRFGWKAQNKSLVIFAGEAYNVEQGVSNEVFPQERDTIPGCNLNASPEDYTHMDAPTAAGSWSDVVQQANFMRFLAPPQPAPATASSTRGATVFTQVGCAMCHTPSMTTGPSTQPALNNKSVNLYSDLAIHHMGQALDDAVSQGAAGTDEFRTAPLWGVGQRLFFLHDGRASNLLDAINAHASAGSEATQVVNALKTLPQQSQQDLINFLRSL